MTRTQAIRASNRYLVMAMVFCGIAVGWAVLEFFAAASRRAANQSVRREVSAAKARLSDLKRSENAELDRIARLKQAFDLLNQRIAKPPAQRDRFAMGRKFLAAHPEAKPLLHQYKVASANSWPVRAARAAGFSEEQVREYADLFLRQKGYGFTMNGIALPDDDSDLSAYDVQVIGLKALAGPELYSKYNAVLASQAGQMYASEVTQIACDIGQPLTVEQSQALLKVFGTSQKAPDWDAATQQAEKILSPDQLAAWNVDKALRTDMNAEDAYRAHAIEAARHGSP